MAFFSEWNLIRFQNTQLMKFNNRNKGTECCLCVMSVCLRVMSVCLCVMSVVCVLWVCVCVLWVLSVCYECVSVCYECCLCVMSVCHIHVFMSVSVLCIWHGCVQYVCHTCSVFFFLRVCVCVCSDAFKYKCVSVLAVKCSMNRLHVFACWSLKSSPGDRLMWGCAPTHTVKQHTDTHS